MAYRLKPKPPKPKTRLEAFKTLRADDKLFKFCNDLSSFIRLHFSSEIPHIKRHKIRELNNLFVSEHPYIGVTLKEIENGKAELSLTYLRISAQNNFILLHTIEQPYLEEDINMITKKIIGGFEHV